MNKGKKLRIEIMDRMFRKGAPVSFADVAEEMNNVFKKCKSPAAYAGIYGDIFRKDLKTIREVLDDPLNGVDSNMLRTKGGNKNRTYWYADPSFSVMPYLTYYYKKTDYKSLDKALALLRDTLPDDVFHAVEFSLRSHIEYEFGKGEKYIDYGENFSLRGRRWLPIIYESLNKEVLKICYKPYYDEPYTFKLCPYLLKQYNNRWFLFGGIDEIKRGFWKNPPKDIEKIDPNYWIVPIDRIEDISVCEGEEMIPRPKNYMDRFAPIIGISQQECGSQTTLPGKSQRITMGIYDINLWGRLTTKLLHNTQMVLKDFDNGYGQIQIEVVPNVEFYDELMGLGKNIVVESPKSVRRKVIERLDSIKERYMK
jgi:hypothetical protein